MKRVLPYTDRSALLISCALILASCGGTPGPAGSFDIAARPATAAVLLGSDVGIDVTVTPQGGFAGVVGAELIDPPAGVSAGPVSATVGGETTLRLKLRAGVAGIVPLKVQVSGAGVIRTQTLNAFVYRALPVPCAGPCPTTVQAGAALLGESSWFTQGQTLSRVDRLGGETRAYPLALGSGERPMTILEAGGAVWVGVQPADPALQMPAMLRLNPADGATTRITLGSPGTELQDLATTPDGEIVAVLRGPQATTSLAIFDVPTRQLSTVPLPGSAAYSALGVESRGHMWTGPDSGSGLWHLSPSSGETSVYGVAPYRGPVTLAATLDPLLNEDIVWFQMPQTQELGLLYTSQTRDERYAFSAGPGTLSRQHTHVIHAAADGSSVQRLSRRADGRGIDALPLPLPAGARNLSISDDGLSAVGLNAEGSGLNVYILPLD